MYTLLYDYDGGVFRIPHQFGNWITQEAERERESGEYFNAGRTRLDVLDASNT